MSVADLETHAELEQRRRYSEPSSCLGRMVVVSQLGVVWELECDRCGFASGLPAREAAPTLHNAQRVDRRRKSSRVPSELQGLALPDDGSRASKAVRAWATGSAERKGLNLTGPVGVGKTHAAAAAAWERARLGPIRWLSVPVLFAQLGRGFSDEGRHAALDVLVGDEALVLDDLDKTRPSEYAAEQLFCAIDSRVTAGAALLCTTNLALSELAERFPEPYGEALVSRLAGYAKTFVLEGADRRLERRAA
jgi:IstB-like ATP binding protein